MVESVKKSRVNGFFRWIASLLVLTCLLVMLYPARTVGAIVHWDGIYDKNQLKIIDVTDEIVTVGTTYVYKERCVKGVFASNALFRDSSNKIENINVEPILANADAEQKDYGKVEIVDNHLQYTPGADAADAAAPVIQVLLKLYINSSNIKDAYRFDFKVGQGEADAESGGLKTLGYQLDHGQTFSVENYDAEIQEYQIMLPSDTLVGTKVTLTGTPLNSQATVSVEPASVSVSSEINTQVLTVTTQDGKVRHYTVQFAIAPPEILPSVTINQTEYKDGDSLLLDFQQEVKIQIDTGSGTVKADSFSVQIEDASQQGCLCEFQDKYGKTPNIDNEVYGKGTSQITVRFYYDARSQDSYTEVVLTAKTRANYSLLSETVADIPADLSLYTDQTVQKLQQLTNTIDYNLDYSAQSIVSALTAEIRDAIDSLEYRPADYSQVDQLMAKLDILPDIYTLESMNAVRKIIESVERDLNICSQNIIDDYADKLQKAIDGLVVRSEEYTELHNLFFQIPEDLSIYSEVTVSKLKEVMQTVREQVSSGSADELSVMLRQAINGLRLIGSVDFSALEAFLETIPDNFDWYTEQTVQTVLKWKEHALALMQDANVLQEQVDECLKQLKIAVEGLTLRKADYSIMDKVLDQLPDDLSGYTAASVEIVTKLIASIDWEMDITRQEQVNLLAEQLMQLISKLVPKQEVVPQPDPDETPSVVIPEIVIPEDIPPSINQKDGWEKEDGEVTFYQNGKKVTGWQQIEGTRYYFTEDGCLTSGWLQLNDGWYYLNDEGIQQSGWIKQGNTWYYLLPKTGVMAADGLKMIEGEIYCFYDWGGMLNTAWYQLGQHWYFFNGGGYMVKEQWVLWKGSWYYLASDGKMACDTITPDGYRVDKDGVWIP